MHPKWAPTTEVNELFVNCTIRNGLVIFFDKKKQRDPTKFEQWLMFYSSSVPALCYFHRSEETLSTFELRNAHNSFQVETTVFNASPIFIILIFPLNILTNMRIPTKASVLLKNTAPSQHILKNTATHSKFQ